MQADTTPEKIVVRVQLQIQPDQLAAFTDYMRTESAEARKLDGCERYQLFQGLDGDATSFLLYEEWASHEAFATYKASPLLERTFATLKPMMAAPPDSAYFTANRFK